MELTEALQQFRDTQRQMHAYRHAKSLITLDGATVAPTGSAPGRGETLAVLSRAELALKTDSRMLRAVETMLRHRGDLDPVLLRGAEEFYRDYERTTRIPEGEQVVYARLLSDADAVWRRAKAEDDFAAFAPYITRIFDSLRRFSSLTDPARDPYDVQMDRYERGLDTAKLEAFFSALRGHLVPLLRRIREAEPVEDGFLWGHFPAWKQRKLTKTLMAALDLGQDRCAVGETEHPFTTWFNRSDVRITTRYREENFTQSMYSVIHEGGHALYELGVSDELKDTGLDGGVSMGVHESQSRFYENMVGRSEAFLTRIYPRCRELFPDALEGVMPRRFYEAVNVVRPSLIRTEADEVTYPLHVMLRCDLERGLMAGTIRTEDLPELWRVKMKEYLGVEPNDDRRGVLQDSHWSGGLVGYFPSYALGTAYAVQLFDRMRLDFDPEEAISRGEIGEITRWLGEKLHRFGRLYDPEPLLEGIWGGPFDPDHYLGYLERKYGEIYRLG